MLPVTTRQGQQSGTRGSPRWRETVHSHAASDFGDTYPQSLDFSGPFFSYFAVYLKKKGRGAWINRVDSSGCRTQLMAGSGRKKNYAFIHVLSNKIWIGSSTGPALSPSERFTYSTALSDLPCSQLFSNAGGAVYPLKCDLIVEYSPSTCLSRCLSWGRPIRFRGQYWLGTGLSSSKAQSL